MKVVNKKLDMIVTNDISGKVTPIRFRIAMDADELQVFNVKVKTFEKIKQDRENIISYVCEVISDGKVVGCELRFYVERLAWVLYKI